MLLGITVALLGNLPVSYAQSDRTADELEELLNEEGDEIEVETEEGLGFPVPDPDEEESPVLGEIGQGPSGPGAAEEDLFLPVPSDQVDAPFLPGGGGRGHEGSFLPFYQAGDLRHSSSTNEDILRKPGTALWVGYALKDYATRLIKNFQNGFEVGLSTRIWRSSFLSPRLSVHLFGAATFINLEDVTYRGDLFVNNKDKTFRLGGLVEWELSRQIALFGGAGRYSTDITTGGVRANDSINYVPAGSVLRRLDADPIFFGVGAQWDFHVQPQGSIGLRSWVELGYTSLLLTFTVEPVPRRQVALNYD